MNKTNIVPVFFSTEDNYAPYLGVALHTLIAHTSQEREYRIYILYTSLSEKNRRTFELMSTENIEIDTVDINAVTTGLKIDTVNHVSVETMYRFFIPELFPEYEYVIYLDCDIIVLQDIAELLEISLGDKVLAAVRGYPTDLMVTHYQDTLLIPIEEFFNTGVLLINCKAFKQKQIKDLCFQTLEQNNHEKKFVFRWPDQDLLNIVCRGEVFFLDSRWNDEWLRYNSPALGDNRELCLNNEMPYILHFDGGIKPWNKLRYNLSSFFWKYARQTIFYEEIIYRLTKKTQDQPSVFTRHKFPYACIPYGSIIAIYGAGGVGMAFIHQLSLTRYCTVELWVDQNYEKIINKGYCVANPEELTTTKYDYVLIAMENEEIAGEVSMYLQSLGVPAEKIVWANPLSGKI